MNKDSKIYIAGHRGLVGSAIWKNLENRGYTNLLGRSSKELDLTDALATEQFFAEEKPEYVFLAAAHVGGIVANNTYRADFIYKNLAIQQNVIGASFRHDVKKLLFLGSTCIYPKNAPQPMAEDVLLTSELEYTNEPYAIAKIAGLKMCESFNIQYGTNYIAVMPTNLYGPNDNFDLERSHVLPALVRKMVLGSAIEKGSWSEVRADLDRMPIKGIDGSASEAEILDMLAGFGVRLNPKTSKVEVEIWGSGKPMREFLWSEEMADACVFVMEKVDFADLHNGGEIRNCHINIGTGKEISIAQVAEVIKKEAGFDGELVFNSTKPDGTMRKLTDVSKLHSLGWKHEVEIEEGVRRIVEWYRQSK